MIFMAFNDRLACSRLHFQSLPFSRVVAIAAIAASMVTSGVRAQQVNPPSQQVKSSAPLPAANMNSGPRWQELTPAQRQILQPLSNTWDGLGSTHKIKWIAVTQSYPSKSPAEQAKMQGRMAEWAALSPAERERARLNFAETKKLSPADLAAEWETYKGLSEQERQNLAKKSPPVPKGAATAITPVAPNKLTSVPITRHTAQEQGTVPVGKPMINPNTLLPAKPVAAPITAPPPEPLSPASAPDTAVDTVPAGSQVPFGAASAPQPEPASQQ